MALNLSDIGRKKKKEVEQGLLGNQNVSNPLLSSAINVAEQKTGAEAILPQQDDIVSNQMIDAAIKAAEEKAGGEVILPQTDTLVSNPILNSALNVIAQQTGAEFGETGFKAPAPVISTEDEAMTLSALGDIVQPPQQQPDEQQDDFAQTQALFDFLGLQDEFKLPTDIQGRTQFDIARQQAETESAEAREARLRELGLQQAAQGVTGGSAFEQERLLERDIRRDLNTQINNITQQELNARFLGQQAQTSRQFQAGLAALNQQFTLERLTAQDSIRDQNVADAAIADSFYNFAFNFVDPQTGQRRPPTVQDLPPFMQTQIGTNPLFQSAFVSGASGVQFDEYKTGQEADIQLRNLTVFAAGDNLPTLLQDPNIAALFDPNATTSSIASTIQNIAAGGALAGEPIKLDPANVAKTANRTTFGIGDNLLFFGIATEDAQGNVVYPEGKPITIGGETFTIGKTFISKVGDGSFVMQVIDANGNTFYFDPQQPGVKLTEPPR